MAELKHLEKRLDFLSLPPDWKVAAVAVDWEGQPLVLFQEGKPPRPAPDAGMDATARWLRTPPNRHHLVHWRGGTCSQVAFENPTALLTTAHVQPFGDGWLLAEKCGGHTRICDQAGNVTRTLNLGDASEHVQTTPDGYIWVGYFDEGVFGNGIGSNGLVCFDSGGVPIFKYTEFAKQHDLPFIDDCYTLNVIESSVWVSYYSDFPLVWLKDFKLEGVWHSLGANQAVAIRGDRLVIFPAYRKRYLTSRTFESSETAVWELADPSGKSLTRLAGDSPETTPTSLHVPFQCAARNGRLYIYDETALYELP